MVLAIVGATLTFAVNDEAPAPAPKENEALAPPAVVEAEAPAPAEPVAEAETPEPVEQSSTFKVGKVKGLDTIIQDLSIREMELTKAVRNLALMSGVNITVGKDVDGTVSCNLRNVTVRQALEGFLRSNGYTYVARGGLLIVVKESEASKFEKGAVAQKIVRKTFDIPYTGTEEKFVAGSLKPVKSDDSKEVVETITEMLSARGKIAYYARQHLIVVEDDEAIIKMIEQFVDAIWEIPLQVFIDSQLLEIALEDGEDFGLRWDIQEKFSHSGDTNRRDGTSTNNAGTTYLGTVASTTGPTMALARAFTYGIANTNIGVVLEALSSRKRTDLHSNPTILVRNHRMGSIIAGQEVPYVSSEESTGGNPIRTIEFKEVAVRLDVTPHVRRNGKIVFLDVHPTVKEVLRWTSDPRAPVISTREAVTSVVMADNTTLVIGGLVQRNHLRSIAETPFINKIPVINWLFRQDTMTDTKTDLIFLLTPRIVTKDLVEQHKEEKEHLTEKIEPHRSEEYWQELERKKKEISAFWEQFQIKQPDSDRTEAE